MISLSVLERIHLKTNHMRTPQTISPVKVIAAVVLLVGGFVGYDLFLANKASAVDNLPGQAPSQAATIVDKIKTITLDGSIFTNPEFTSLQDLTVPVPPEPLGKDNPFAPIPGNGPTPASTKGTTASKTSTAAKNSTKTSP